MSAHPADRPEPATAPRLRVVGSAARPTLYDRTAAASAAVVIRSYSTSFGWATRLLAEPARGHVRDIYALVRIADEVVDCPELPLDPAGRRRALDALEAQTYAAIETGYSTDLVVHAFATTARACGIGRDLVEPFLASMRADLTVSNHDAPSLQRYVYGSAEVVGLMCLRAFLAADGAPPYAELAPGAQRLGAAFQKVNFLRDLAADHALLGRTYFPGLDVASFTDAHRDALLDDIDADLAAADLAIRRLPAGSRRAVRAAHGLFAELSRRLRRTPAQEITRRRVRVPGPVKARILLAAAGGRA